MEKKALRTIAQNKKAFHDYFVEESLEAGIELTGTEVKSLRQGRVNLKDSWCSVDKGEMWVNGVHISPYEQGNIFNRDPMRVRRLLLHKREIHAPVWLGQAGRVFPGAVVSLLQGFACQSAGWPVQGQKEL